MLSGLEGLAAVHRRVDVVLGDELERLPVGLGRVVLLLPRQVERQHAAALVGHRQLGERQRDLGRHRADPADDDARGNVQPGARVAKPGDHRVHDVLERQAPLAVQDRRVAHLEVADTLGRAVLDQLVGDAVEGVLLLHHRQRDVEDLEVVRQVPRALAGLQQARQAGQARRRQTHLLLGGQFEDGAGPHAAVEMAVQLGLRDAANDVECELHRSCVPSRAAGRLSGRPRAP